MPPVVCDLAGLDAGDLSVVDALARLQLVLARHGGDLRLRGVAPDLHALLTLAGIGKLVDADGAALDVSRDTSAAGRTAGRAWWCRGRT